MKPAPFEHLAPADVTEALTLLRDHAPDARLLAGGQSLVPMLNFRLSRPGLLIDLNGIADLAYIRDQGDHLAIGAMTRERAIEDSELVREAVPLLHEATLRIGHLSIRNRGTIGGSLANADPAAEYPAVVLALDCEMVIRSAHGQRRVAAGDFFQGALTTAIEPDELLAEIVVPKAPAGSGSAFVEIARRRGDFALAGVAAQVTLSGGDVTGVRLAACGVGDGPVRLVDAERIILRDGLGEKAVKAAGRAAADEVDPTGDLHASADYRCRLAGIMVMRALTTASMRAGGDE
ncbi:MAG: xanthine dehydrogenase family protein subunit M [Alphaproteobacteria bacterium]